MRMPAWISITVISAVLIPVASMSAQEWNRPGITAYLIQRCVGDLSRSAPTGASLAGHGITIAAFCDCQGKFLAMALSDQQIARMADDPSGAETLNKTTDTAQAFCLGRLSK
jgi:hypothetical protein